VTAAEASDAGQKSLEHLHWIALAAPACYETAMGKPDAPEACVEAAQQELFQRLVRNGTWVVPTNIVEQALVEGDPRDPRLEYLPPAVRRLWEPREDMRTRGESGDESAIARRMNRRDLEWVGALHRAGVPLLAGTDTASWNPYTFPGFSLHDQLALLVQAGLTPMEALQTATLNPARFLGREKDLGAVRKGRLADLVLLDANPLQDIRNTRRIHAVVAAGRLLDRVALDRILAEVADAAAAR
jgi:hypothetical protein